MPAWIQWLYERDPHTAWASSMSTRAAAYRPAMPIPNNPEPTQTTPSATTPSGNLYDGSAVIVIISRDARRPVGAELEPAVGLTSDQNSADSRHARPRYSYFLATVSRV